MSHRVANSSTAVVVFLLLFVDCATSATVDSWRAHLQQTLAVSNRPLAEDRLARVALSGWNYTLPHAALRKGVGYVGSNHRLRRVIMDAVHGKPIKIGFVGGSITFGDYASKYGVTDWAALVGRWAQSVFPNVTFRNGAVPATPSSYMAVCLEHSADPDTDLMFAEYLLNDAIELKLVNNSRRAGYERLVRRVLSMHKKPAMVIMQTWAAGQTLSPNTPKQFGEKTNFDASLEYVYSAVAQYYDVGYLSFMTATERLDRLKVPGLGYETLIRQQHPLDPGHKAMADLVVWLMQQTALDLLMRPLDTADAAQIREPLPPPMVANNEAPNVPMCLLGPTLKKVVLSHQGWEFINEGTEIKPKTGYISTTPGSKLVLVLDSSRPVPGNVVVSIMHLKSYEHMGKALVRCESGCSCPEREIDAHHTVRTSQTFLGTMEVSQHPQCTLSVTVIQATSSGEHKFKVAGVTLSDLANPKIDSFTRDKEQFQDIYSHGLGKAEG